jgi:hypothetical protein
MKHPKREEWVPFLFGETTPGAQHELSEHLRGCADCRQEIETWQRSLGRLDAWKLPPVRRTAPALAPAFTWAAAAALVLLLGFSIGRLSAKADAQKIRAAITPQIKQELTEELTRRRDAGGLGTANRAGHDVPRTGHRCQAHGG